jgi:hypothetical protein
MRELCSVSVGGDQFSALYDRMVVFTGCAILYTPGKSSGGYVTGRKDESRVMVW